MLGNNMFAYCLNNPIKFRDDDGQRADSYAGWVGEEFGKLIYEWLTGDDHPSHITEQVDMGINQQQNELIRNIIVATWDIYNASVERQAENSMNQANMTNKYISDRFSTPEKASNTLAACAGVLEGISLATRADPRVSAFFETCAWVVGGFAVVVDWCSEE